VEAVALYRRGKDGIMGANDAMVLRDVKGALETAAAAEAAGMNLDDLKKMAGPGGMDEAALAEAGDVGAPPELITSRPVIVKALRILRESVSRRGEELTEADLVDLAHIIARHEGHHAHRHGHRVGFAHGLRYARRMGLGGHMVMPGRRHEFDLLPNVFWRRSAQMDEFRWDIIRRYSEYHNGRIAAGIGFYYATWQAALQSEGSPANAAFVVNVPPSTQTQANPVIDTCFDLAIGDTEVNWLGGQHVLNLSDTNLQNPGAFLYQDQLMIIEAVSVRLKAIRIQYYQPGASTAGFPNIVNTPVTAGVLAGTFPVWDRNNLILPQEFFNQYSDVSELAQALAMVTTIVFAWDDKGVGGNEDLATKPVERMCAVPGHDRRGVQETSGAGLTLDLSRGFIWCLDKQFQANTDAGGNGLFSAQLRQSESFAFPFTPLQLYGSAGPVMPIACALEWQLTLWGTSLVPAKSLSERPLWRRRM
jgi:hypothetical protein